jgi:hypothetical protein
MNEKKIVQVIIGCFLRENDSYYMNGCNKISSDGAVTGDFLHVLFSCGLWSFRSGFLRVAASLALCCFLLRVLPCSAFPLLRSTIEGTLLIDLAVPSKFFCFVPKGIESKICVLSSWS